MNRVRLISKIDYIENWKKYLHIIVFIYTRAKYI